MNSDHKLESGSELKITLAPFADSKALYQAFLEEIKELKIDGTMEMDFNFFKNVLCAGLASKKVEQALSKCMERVLYNGFKINADTFESVEARGDYLEVCFLVAKENIEPFTKGLFAKFGPKLQGLIKGLQ